MNKTKTSIIRKNFFICLLVGLCLHLGVAAQGTHSVKGIVKDPAGEAIIGATVLQKGTSNGTTTDFEGKFSINVPVNAVLAISYIGYVSQDVSVNGQSSLTVTLKDNEKLLNEVVVIGYGTVKKNDATGAVTAIKPDAMNKGLTTNAQDMLSGKIAGVNVVSAGGAPGGGAAIRIRGGASLNASNDPLIIIDGLAMDNNGVKGLSNPLSMVNPNDIESFTVLKDASATAIYGSRASNGVIIITTKKGLSGSKPKVSYAGNVSVSNVRKTLDVLSGDEFRKLASTLYGDDQNIMNALGTSNTDWQKEIYRTAFSNDHNLTMTGGFKNMPYRFSLGYTNQNGILKTSNFERYTASFNLSPSLLNKHLTMNLNAKGMYAKNHYADGGAVGAAVAMDPTQSVHSSIAEFGNYFQWSTPGKDLNDQNASILKVNSLATKNPVAMLDLKDDRATSQAFIGSAEFDYKVHGFEELRLHVNMGADISTGKQNTNVSPYSGTDNYYGFYKQDKEDKYNLSFSSYAHYSKDLEAAKQHVDVMAGYEWQHFHRQGHYNQYGLYPSTNTVDPGAQYNPVYSAFKTESFLVSFFGRANYSLLDRYLLTFTLRDDGSSRFSKDNRWALFPSLAFGWKMKEESFLKDVAPVTDLKLRLGYGITGQQNITDSDYPYLPFYVNNKAGAYYYFGDDKYSLSRPTAYNKDLKWEQTTTWNAGIDFGFLNNRLNGSVDFYYRKTNDLINKVTVPAGSNFSNKVLSNVGTMNNRGLEVALTYRAITTKDLTWELGANMTYNKNKITKLTTGSGTGYYVATGGITAGTGGNAQAHKVGYAASSFYVYQQVYDKDGKPIENLFVDRNGDGIINDADKYIYKNPMGDVQLGFTSKVIYKSWDLSFSMRAKLNNYVYNDVLSNNANVSYSGVWSTSGFFSNRPKAAVDLGWSGTGNYMFSDYFVQNASFLKLDNITLGYSFNKLFGKSISGRTYLTGQNIMTITKYKGLDPEVMNIESTGAVYGIDKNLYPRPIMGILGLTLNF